MIHGTPKTKALTCVLFCVVLWAFIPVVSKLGQNTLDHYQFLFWSSLLSLVVVCAAALVSGRLGEIRSYSKKSVFHALFLGFLGTFLYYLLLYYGYAHAEGLEVLVLQYTWPIFVVVFSVILLKERLSSRTSAALILGFAGAVLVLTKGKVGNVHLQNARIDVIVLVAAGIFGLFSVLSKRALGEPFSLNILFFLSALLCSTVSVFLFSDFAWPQGSAWLPIIANGAFVNGLSYILWVLALRNATASSLAPFVFLTPVLAAFLVVFFFHEPLLPTYLFGLAAVVIAGLLAK